MNYRDTTMVYNNVKFYYGQDNKTKRFIEGLSGVSPFRMKKALKSYNDFNDLRLNEIIKLEKITTNIGGNVKLGD